MPIDIEAPGLPGVNVIPHDLDAEVAAEMPARDMKRKERAIYEQAS